MPTPLPPPPKRRGAPSAGAENHAKPTMAYDTRIKWNMIILVTQLLLAQIGLWGLFMKVVNNLVGETVGWIFDWLVVLLPALNVVEALWTRAKRPVAVVANEPPKPSSSPVQKRIQSLSTTVPASVLNSPLPRALDSSRNDTPSRASRREPQVLDLTLPHGFTPDSSMVSGFSSPSPSVRARARMQKSAAASASGPVRVPDLFDSRASSLEPNDAVPGSGNAMTASRSRRRDGASSREPSPFSISSLPVKKAPKTGRALDSSSLRGLVS